MRFPVARNIKFHIEPLLLTEQVVRRGWRNVTVSGQPRMNGELGRVRTHVSKA